MDAGLIIAESTCMIITTITGMLAYRKMNAASRLLLFQVFLAFGFFLLTYGLTIWQKEHQVQLNNQAIFNLYILIETALLLTVAFMYSGKWPGRKLFILVLILYSAVLITELCFSGVSEFLNYTYVVGSVSVSLFFFVILYQIFNTEVSGIVNNPIVWISIGMIIYYVCCIPYFILFDFLNSRYPELSNFLFVCINIVLANVRYLLISYGFWLMYKQGRMQVND